MTFVRMLVVAYIVLGVLDILAKRSKNRENRNSKRYFIIRAPIEFIFLGALGGATSIGVLMFCEITNVVIKPVMFGAVVAICIFPSFLLMIAPIKGVWDVIVDGDDITVVKAFIFKSHWKFSTIVRCKQTRGGAKVYVEGRKRKAFFVDGMVDGSNLFMKRIEEAGIPIE